MMKISSSDLVRFHRVVARIVAHLAGSKPELVWPAWDIFEDDMSTLVDVLGALEDTAKPFLEERERLAQAGRRAGKEPIASRVVTSPAGSNLDDEATE